MKKAREMSGNVEQFNGREGETATFLSRCPLNLNLSVTVSPYVDSAVKIHLVKIYLIDIASNFPRT